MPPPPARLLTLKIVSESRVTWATSVPILAILGLSVLDLGPMYATERQTDVRQTSDAHHRLMPPTIRAGHNSSSCSSNSNISCNSSSSISVTVVLVDVLRWPYNHLLRVIRNLITLCSL